MDNTFNYAYSIRGDLAFIESNPRTMDDINVGEIYLVMKPWSIRMTDGRMLVEVKEKHKTYAICENVSYPSFYGMSKKFNICFDAFELKEEYRIKSYEDLRKYIYNLPTFAECPGFKEEMARLKELFERSLLYV